MSDFTFVASQCDTVSPSVPPQYRDFIIICRETHSSVTSDPLNLSQSHQYKTTESKCASHLERAVRHVTDVDDVVGRVVEHLSKPDGTKDTT